MRLELTREQQWALDGIISRVRRGATMTKLGGYAGTGKSTILAAVRYGLTRLNLKVLVAAPTGKAADVLQSKGHPDAGTIHSLFYRPVKRIEKQTITRPDGTKETIEHVVLEWEKKQPEPFDVLIVDEASMVSREIYSDLLAVGFPTVYVGDHGQLPPVGESQINLMTDPHFKLETIHRNSGDIVKFAQHLREGNTPRSFKPTDGTVHFGHTETADVYLCGTNKARNATNHATRQRLGYSRLIENGEKLLSLRNSPALGLANGSILTPTAIGSTSISWRDRYGCEMTTSYDPEFFGREKYPDAYGNKALHPFDYGYALTCHKSQGSEWPVVDVIDQSLVFQRNGLEAVYRWRYTAATRAKSHLWWG